MSTAKASGLNSTREAIEERTRIFEQAMAHADPSGVANCYTEDAEFMAPNGNAVVGRKNIQSAIAGFIKQGFTEYHVSSSIVYGNTGVVGVQTAYTLSQKGGKNKDIGKSIQLWKQENGVWKIFRDCFNSDLPATN